jgi:hypothetical protein
MEPIADLEDLLKSVGVADSDGPPIFTGLPGNHFYFDDLLLHTGDPNS